MKRAVFLLALLAASCSNSSGPSASSIAGKWHISGRDIRFPAYPAATCTLEADIEITEFAHGIDGAWSNGVYDCGANLTGEPLGGYVDGADFVIAFDTYYFSFEGTWRGSTMSGALSFYIPFGNERWHGTFTGRRR